MKLELLLVWLLRLGAVVLLLATFAVFMPFTWMASAYKSLGFPGELPALPIVAYLARSLALVYALWGVMLWYVSLDVRRFAPVIRLLGWINIILGIALLPLDSLAGMPKYWTIVEGPTVVIYGALLWWMAQRYEAAKLT